MKAYVAAIVGFIAAAIAAALALTLSTVASTDSTADIPLVAILSTFLIYLYGTTAVSVLGGVPVFLALNYFGAVRLWTSVTAGGVVAMVALLLFMQIQKLAIGLLVYCVVVGMLAGLIFWVIWNKRAAAPTAA